MNMLMLSQKFDKYTHKLVNIKDKNIPPQTSSSEILIPLKFSFYKSNKCSKNDSSYVDNIGKTLIKSMDIAVNNDVVIKHVVCEKCHSIFTYDGDDNKLIMFRKSHGYKGNINMCPKCDKQSS